MRRTRTSRVLADLVQPTGAFSPDIVIDITEFVADEGEVLVDFVVPVFNQAEIITRSLQSIVESSILANCLVVVVDGCTDDTLRRVLAWAGTSTWQLGNTRRVIVAATAEPVFETMADSIGIALCSSRFIIEVQADMLMSHPAFDELLINALEARKELIAVSGRGTERQPLASGQAIRVGAIVARVFDRLSAIVERVRLRNASAYSPSRLSFLLGGRAGRIGELIEMPTRVPHRQSLFVGQSVMRGPLALRRDYLEDLGGLDTGRYFLGNDDHDLMMRAWRHRGYVCGYVAVSFSSPLAEGTTRRVRDPAAAARFNELEKFYSHARAESAEHGRSPVRLRSRRRIIRLSRSPRVRSVPKPGESGRQE